MRRMNKPPIRKRRKRFLRASGTRIRLTDDDVAIMQYVAQYRFLRSTHIAKLLPHRPFKKLVERIGALYHAGYLDRPKAQLDYFTRAGSARMVYALGHRASDVLPAGDWRYASSARRPYIEHALLVADVLIAFKMTVSLRSNVEMLDEKALVEILAAEGRTTSFSLSVDVKRRGRNHRIPIVPDAVFALRHASGRTAYFFLEADCGTMKINSQDLSQSSLRRKFIGYNVALKGELHVKRFGFSNARVLTVTTKPERVAGMIAALNAETAKRPTGRFLFADVKALLQSDPLSMMWRTNDKPTSLTPTQL